MSSLSGGGSVCASPNCYVCLLWLQVSSTSLRMANSPQLSKNFSIFFSLSHSELWAIFRERVPKIGHFAKVRCIYIYGRSCIITITKTITITRATLPIPSTRQPVFVRLLRSHSFVGINPESSQASWHSVIRPLSFAVAQRCVEASAAVGEAMRSARTAKSQGERLTSERGQLLKWARWMALPEK